MPDVLSASGQAAGWVVVVVVLTTLCMNQVWWLGCWWLVASVAILHQNRSQTTSHGLTRHRTSSNQPSTFYILNGSVSYEFIFNITSSAINLHI